MTGDLRDRFDSRRNPSHIWTHVLLVLNLSVSLGHEAFRVHTFRVMEQRTEVARGFVWGFVWDRGVGCRSFGVHELASIPVEPSTGLYASALAPIHPVVAPETAVA